MASPRNLSSRPISPAQAGAIRAAESNPPVPYRRPGSEAVIPIRRTNIRMTGVNHDLHGKGTSSSRTAVDVSSFAVLSGRTGRRKTDTQRKHDNRHRRRKRAAPAGVSPSRSLFRAAHSTIICCGGSLSLRQASLLRAASAAPRTTRTVRISGVAPLPA